MMWKEMQTLPPDGRQSETAPMIARGVRRLLRARGFSSLTELPLTDGRRADIAAVNRDGEVLIVEVKSCAADFRADRKWRDYAVCCDRLYFAISEHTPADLMPLEAGLIVADPYGAEIVRERNSSAWRRPAGARCYCASPRPPPTGCIVWPILRGPRNSRADLILARSGIIRDAASDPRVNFGRTLSSTRLVSA
jgi:hypothetical protein